MANLDPHFRPPKAPLRPQEPMRHAGREGYTGTELLPPRPLAEDTVNFRLHMRTHTETVESIPNPTPSG